ncbi:hypothetical protein Phpb_02498 [Photorhabdus namnaonensis]|uniref:Uncharacterized protein n=1 Tax=Photorhabdus namnaonensis TaxID=1851568 RepID=A0A1B8YHJ0_9GAMM|nr:hypothetical protein Phpb_02498 [Photorhabdus namnaonensis]
MKFIEKMDVHQAITPFATALGLGFYSYFIENNLYNRCFTQVIIATFDKKVALYLQSTEYRVQSTEYRVQINGNFCIRS